jgi:hypothetical protein
MSIIHLLCFYFLSTAFFFCSLLCLQTDKGTLESQRLGIKIKEIVGEAPLFIYCSPYLRAKQTLKGVVESLGSNHIVGAREEPRITGEWMVNGCMGG